MKTYTNPVYSGYFADPFVWQHQGIYYAIGTGAAEAAGHVDEVTAGLGLETTKTCVFPLLRSLDFVDWQFMGNALLRPDPALGNNYWAPEIAYWEGQFYLYYSVGHEDKLHQLRVASSENPLGPYQDLGKSLISLEDCPFAIDPHPFQDDGQWYLFYARDFLDTDGGFQVGTGLYVDRLTTMTQLAGAGKVVLRARSPWQRFLTNRLMYGKIYDWYTVEGPCIRKHGGKYYCFYSGGRWETVDYGVDYGIANHVMGPYSDAGNENGPRVLKTIPNLVRGPGHNSIVVGPDGQTDYIVYHAWENQMDKRQICLDKLIWTPDGPRCHGPTLTPQAIA